MGKTVYFHIGTVKTGSTFLQKVMWENRSALQNDGLDYVQVTPPKLHLPRYANADFLDDPSLHQTARELFESSPCDRVVISEEGLFGRPQLMLAPMFDGFRKEVVVYVRQPAELVASSAAEMTMPYNAFTASLPWQAGLLPYEMAIQMLSNVYAACMGRCYSVFAQGGFESITVRPFETAQLARGDLLEDFLSVIGICATAFRESAKSHLSDHVNSTRSRKFYDVSFLTWKYLQDRGRVEEFSHDLVEEVFAACQSGDERSPIETLDDATIEAISLELAFVEEDLVYRGLAREPFFQNRFPKIYGTSRHSVKPVSVEEVGKLVELLVRRSH